MEHYWTLFNRNSTTSSLTCTPDTFTNSHAWQEGLSSGSNSPFHANELHSLMSQQPGYTSSSSHCAGTHCFRSPDPHLMCLKLGKRNYFHEQQQGPVSFSSKKGKHPLESSAESSNKAQMPRCQVEGCDVWLVKAKEYHRRHKVCEMHAKAPRVMVHGIEQRFCQQCSRFHAVGEFDESKRSCRRRLAGHNERRRKSSQDNSLARKLSQAGSHPQTTDNSGKCALSLLSSTHNNPPNDARWNINLSPDLPARCSAALRELIAENRVSVLAACSRRQQPNSHDTINDLYGLHDPSTTWAGGLSPHVGVAHPTLDLMRQANPNYSAIDLFSVHDYHHFKKGGKGGGDCNHPLSNVGHLWS